MSKKEIETYCPKSQTDWRKWLIKNHQSKQSVWLVYYRASTKIPSLSWSEAVDEALCFGWIALKNQNELKALRKELKEVKEERDTCLLGRYAFERAGRF